MSAGPSRPLNQQLDRLWQSGTVSGLDDAELLRRFRGTRTPAAEHAFEVLIDRHGPMVLAVCRGILKRPHDADDAFQATFLALVRKAGSIRLDGSLAPWLYAVAYRTALRARSQAARQPSTANADRFGAPGDSSGEVPSWELGPMVHQELARLPEKYRAPIVLCHLEGKSHEEAARLLNWPVGTVSGRLSRGRQVLRGRLERRGLGTAMILLGPAPPLPAVPAGLARNTLVAALHSGAVGSVPTLTTLASGVTTTMFQTRLSRLLLVLASVSTVGVAIVLRPVWTPAVFGSNSQSPQSQAIIQPPTPPQPAPGMAGPAAQPGGGMMAGGGGMGSMMGAMMGGGGMMAGMMATAPFGAKHSPTLADPRDPIPLFRMGSIVVVETDDGKALAAMNTQAQDTDWKRYQFPPGVTVTPIGSGDLVTFAAKGETVKEVAAFSAHTHEWATQPLLSPVKEEISPVVGLGSALFQEGNNFYAFSAGRGLWDVLKLDGSEKPRASLNESDITVQQGSRVYVFPLRTGRWSKGIGMKPFGKAVPGPDGIIPSTLR